MENNISTSICIPTYEMNGYGTDFLRFSFEKIKTQTFRNFEVVISDHSIDRNIQNLCLEYSKHFEINYIRNKKNKGSSSSNLNTCILNCKNKIIKILFQDDFLYDNTSLQSIINSFDIEKDKWLVTASEHSYDGTNFYRKFYPRYDHQIHLGNNTISSPSVLTIINDEPLLFDENLIWLMDCDYYRRCYDKFGYPKICNEICVVNRTGHHQVSLTIVNKELELKEKDYIKNKFNVKP